MRLRQRDGFQGAGVMSKKKKKAPKGEKRLIEAEDAEVVIEHHPEDWLAFVIFWLLAFIVFLQFFTRYVLNDSLSWTEEIARYGLMWVVFIGGAMVTRRNTHIAVELLSNVMKPGPLRAALLALVDFIKLAFLGLLAFVSLTITERMHLQRMTVFDLPMSYVYAGVAFGCFLMLIRQAQNVWRNARIGWSRPDDVTHQISAD
jgi:TRAP-type C4-dicarboxylate transport system permease small subunit